MVKGQSKLAIGRLNEQGGAVSLSENGIWRVFSSVLWAKKAFHGG